MRIISKYILILASLVFFNGQSLNASQQNAFTERDSAVVNNLNSFKIALQEGSPYATVYYNRILNYLVSRSIKDSLLISDCYYYTGTYKYIQNEYDDAIDLLQNAINYRIATDSIDDTYAKARTNLGLSYLYSGKPEDARINLETALVTRERIFGTSSVNLSNILLNLTAAYIDLNMYERALSVSLRGVHLAEDNPDDIDKGRLAKLYYNSGASYMNILDYNRARRNFELAYGLAQETSSLNTETLLLLYNSMAACNYELANNDLSNRYFDKALNLIDSTAISGRRVNAVYENYAFTLAEGGLYDKANHYLQLSVEKAVSEYGNESRDYIIQLMKYSYFLMHYVSDYDQAEKLLNTVLLYVNDNEQDNSIRRETYLYYARLLYNTGRNKEALSYINYVINDTTIVPSYIMIASFIQKSKILYKSYITGYNTQNLIEALSSAERAIDIIEQTRLSINADESRSRVSGRFFDAYDIAIDMLNELYEITEEKEYLERAFSVSEKSKAAGLLSATRNNRAMNFHLPGSLARLERTMMADISDYNEVIYNESAKQDPDNELIDQYRLRLVRASERYDSLISIFEKEYPRFYNLKFSTDVSNVDDIRERIGRKANFIEYYLSDSLLYIFLINREKFEIKSVPAGVDLHDMVLDFRNILTNPSIANTSRKQYHEFVELSYKLFCTLILPVKDNLISERLIISADGLLAYIPFETLISELPEYDEINYRELAYLLKKYEIIYEYSGTILSETVSSRPSIFNKVLSFAPEYKGSIDIEELMMSRQSIRENLSNIPGAREEAIFINKLLGGELYLDDDAIESTFKSRVIEGDIIHMAMHTLLNDNDPMYSKMIFNMESDTIEDGMLNTYEIYNIPVKSKIMFLSSCNTGTGYMQSGEGVMSLARGFFYSGSPCVIMSLWEVDDLSGSGIVKDFYVNLKKGYTKSKSLKRARMNYLAEADQMRSHPYFWSTLVIMGNDDSVYFPVKRYILIALIIIMLYFVSRYYYRRKSA